MDTDSFLDAIGISDKALTHYGVKGMKWGFRKPKYKRPKVSLKENAGIAMRRNRYERRGKKFMYSFLKKASQGVLDAQKIEGLTPKQFRGHVAKSYAQAFIASSGILLTSAARRDYSNEADFASSYFQRSMEARREFKNR